jgi:hypothetical protein
MVELFCVSGIQRSRGLVARCCILIKFILSFIRATGQLVTKLFAAMNRNEEPLRNHKNHDF